jgi:hypothetical protein
MAKDPKPETTKPETQPTSSPPPAEPTPTRQESGQGDTEGGQDGPDVLKEATEKGYLGETPDDRPNEDYTVEGVTKGPDVTDPEYAEQKGVEPSEGASEGQTQ